MNPNRRLAILAISTTLALTALLAGCGGGGGSAAAVAPPPPPAQPTSVERDISPVAADPQVSTALEAHVAINPSASVSATNKLFVFLPGTTGIPDYYRLILRSGASRGFHALGLNYPNSEAVGVICLAEDTSCFWDVRREVITGVDHSNLVNVDSANSIATRVAKAVAYLNTNYPNEGWGQYVSGGTPVWSKIIVAGHSQGGGHAGVMTKLYSLSRAVYFSSPPDWSVRANAPASWTTMSNVTPTSSQYAFGNVNDTLVQYSELSVIWQSMGLPALGAAVSVDATTSYGGTHLLTTAVPGTGNSTSPTHGSTVRDEPTPKNSSGAPIFDPVWAYLCFQ